METIFNKNWLNELLNKEKISLYEFAKTIKKPLPTVERWKTGSKPGPDNIVLIINKYGVKPEHFFIKNYSFMNK